MVRKFIQWGRLFRKLVWNKTPRTNRYDYAQQRRDLLRGLEDFIPSSTKKSSVGGLKKWLGNSYLAGQAAFIRNAFKSKGGHLSVPKLHLAYVRIPKAGSTSFSYAMLSARYPNLPMRDLSPEKINFLTDVNIQPGIAEGEKSYAYFAVVRNPFARIVSVYREFFERPSPRFIYDDYLFGILQRSNSFPEFIRTLQTIPDALKDQHLKPQNCLLDFYHKKNIGLEILKLEDQESIRRFLLPYRLTVAVLNKHHVSYDYRTYYDTYSAKIVFDLYSKDIRLFGYTQQYEELKNFLERNTGTTVHR
jgi:hypothetical protein